MSGGIMRSSTLTVLTTLLLACSSGFAMANFQYIPDNGSMGSNSSSLDGGTQHSGPASIPVTRLPIAPSLPMQTSQSKSSISGGPVINGFGNQVPLVIALRQIVPASYQFAFADGINLGTLVNWKGGKPWRNVMNNVVAPLGLTAVEKNMVIYVGKQP